jgi:hypothetical protein
MMLSSTAAPRKVINFRSQAYLKRFFYHQDAVIISLLIEGVRLFEVLVIEKIKHTHL